MKRLYEWEEFDSEDEIDDHEVSIDDLKNTFYYLDKPYLARQKPFNFLYSLNLTKEQYLKLNNLIDDYAQQRYSDGDNGIDPW